MDSTTILFRYETTPVQPDHSLVEAYQETNRTLKINRLNRTFKGFFIGSLLGLTVLFSPVIYTEARYRIDTLIPDEVNPQEERIKTEYPQVKSPSFQSLLNQKYLEILKPVDPEFSIIVPKLGINTHVSANVSAADKKQYEPALKKGAAHALGTNLPGENGRIFIFAHSTDNVWNIARFNAVFYLLKDLEANDQVHIVYKGVVHPYVVTDKKIVGADDIEYLTARIGTEELILQTCYPPGTTNERMLIFAKPSGDFPRLPELSYSLDK
jgi:LPXTG-site transpeptidase (sortase) family protein